MFSLGRGHPLNRACLLFLENFEHTTEYETSYFCVHHESLSGDVDLNQNWPTAKRFRKEIQGFFSIPVDNLRASPFLLAYVRENIPDYKNAVVVAKSPGVMNKATSYADRLR